MFYKTGTSGSETDRHILVGKDKVKVGKTLKYLEVTLNSSWRFDAHLNCVVEKAGKMANALSKLLPNVGGPRSARRRLYTQVVHSVLMYAAPIWTEETLSAGTRRALCGLQKQLALRVISGYRTIAHDAALILATIMSYDLQACVLRCVYEKVQDRLGQEEHVDQRHIEEIRKHKKQLVMREWQARVMQPGGYGLRVREIFRSVLRE